MKKILSLVLVIALAATTLCACGSDESKEADTQKTESKDTMIMATNAEFPPYEYMDGSEIVGIDVEMAKAVADKLGYNIRIEDMSFDSIIPAIVSGKAAIGVAGMTVTDERKESVDFTEPYAQAVQAIIVKDGSKIKKADDLFVKGSDWKVGVQLGTTGDIYCTDDLEEHKSGTVEEYQKGADAVQALVSGKIDCVVIDNEPAKKFVEANEGLKILKTEYAVEDYAIAISKDNPELKDKINDALKEMKEDGTLQGIIDKYIKAE